MQLMGHRTSKGHAEIMWEIEAKMAALQLVGTKSMAKYWHSRYQLFSRLDEGIKMDREGWYSVTPEKNATEIAYRMVKMMVGQPSGTYPVILDGFAGVGGNTIQFANAGARVIAVDIDDQRLRCAKANSTVYGVQDHIEFILGNFFHVLRSFDYICQPIDAIFLSPPWGGPAYARSPDGKERQFDPEIDLQPVGATELISAACRVSKNIALYLPKNTPEDKVEDCSDIYGNRKALIAYYGDLRLWSREDEKKWANVKTDIQRHYWEQQPGAELPTKFGRMSTINGRRSRREADLELAANCWTRMRVSNSR